MYDRIRKVHATHITLDGRATMMAFIQCTYLLAAIGHSNFVGLYKKILNQAY